MANTTSSKKGNKSGFRNEVSKLFDRLEVGVKSTFVSDNFQAYLALMSKFYNYSANNICLILMQCPNATQVASATLWNDLGRHPKKGSKAIRIILPNPYKKKVEEKDEEGNIVIKEKEAIFYSIGNVFDVNDTEGEELPTICKELEGSSDEIKELIDVVTKVSKYPISYWSLKDGSKGFFSKQKGQIVIKKGMSDMQTLITLVHEVSYSRLHENTTKSKQEKEIEAESLAFVVCNFLGEGIDTADYSFEYVASWAQGKDVKELKSILNSIQKEARSLIHEIEAVRAGL